MNTYALIIFFTVPARTELISNYYRKSNGAEREKERGREVCDEISAIIFNLSKCVCRADINDTRLRVFIASGYRRLEERRLLLCCV